MRLPAVEGTSWGQTHHQPPSSFTVQEPYSKIGHLRAGVGPRGLTIWAMWVTRARTATSSREGKFTRLGCVSYLGLILLHSRQV